MKRTKHIVNILTAAVTLLLTASCNVSYPDLDLPQGEPPTNDEDVNIDKTSILLYTSNPAYFSVVSDTRGSVGTRGTGAFEPMETVAYNRDKYLNSKFHIFAFRAYNDADPNGGQGVLTIIAKTKCAFFQNEMCIFCIFFAVSQLVLNGLLNGF